MYPAYAGGVCYAGICPFLYLAAVIVIKRTIIGAFKPGPKGSSAWQLFRHWLMASLLPNGSLGGTLGCLGAHWEPVSIIYRWEQCRAWWSLLWHVHARRVSCESFQTMLQTPAQLQHCCSASFARWQCSGRRHHPCALSGRLAFVLGHAVQRMILLSANNNSIL